MKSSSLSILLGLGLLALACEKSTTVTPEPQPLVDTTPVAATPAPVVWPDEPFRAERPQPGPAKPLELPSVSLMTLSNGLEVHFVEQTNIPTLTMFVEWDVGDANDPRNKAGRVLPAELSTRWPNRGMEGLTITPDGTTLLAVNTAGTLPRSMLSVGTVQEASTLPVLAIMR